MDSRTHPRQRLISSAVTLLAEEGVEAVTLRRVAREVGMSHGAPLRHFTGRAALLSAVAATGFLELHRRGELLAQGPSRERLLAACRDYVEYALAHPAMFELMFRHDLIDAGAAELASANEALFAAFHTLVGAAQAQGWRGDTDPRLLTTSLWAALHGLAELWLWGGLDTTSAAAHIEAALAVTLETYLGI
jgi:AcrR family transcriptional regulator